MNVYTTIPQIALEREKKNPYYTVDPVILGLQIID